MTRRVFPQESPVSTEDVEKNSQFRGSCVPDSLSVAPVRSDNGEVVGERAIHIDVTVQRKASGAAHRLAAIIEQTMGADQIHI